MKVLIALTLVGFTAVATADPSVPETQAVEQYTYSTHLDIAKIVSMSEVPDVCLVIPKTMTYEDHQGQRHTIQYQVMGDGCGHG